ncbi:hypothetical protein [Streptomyces vilmorinianum]|uniref:hypothetical protein n=1 Tax=Streptomyces vilmorinianum TaxID=3051092 RepID=UPI001586AF42|nr:hypothetical protein [Streptomyces vilmorinianum]
MKKILTAALTGLAVAGSLGTAGTAAAESDLPSVVPLSGVLAPKAKPAAAADMPPANAAVEKLLPGPLRP